MQIFKDINYTKPIGLFFLMISTPIVFFGCLLSLNEMLSNRYVIGLIPLIISLVYFLILKKKFIVKTSDFKLTSRQLEWDNKIVEFNTIKYELV